MNPNESAHHDRLWTPWRMRYIGGESREEGCIFCNRLTGTVDVDSLILHRSTHAFVIMNLFPYNTGHVMIVPNSHEPEIDALDEPTLIDMATLLPKVTTSLQSVLGCQGFNVGLNLGSIAGAGVAEHLHQHVVPRWEGDANFMPIIAGTMAIPELIPTSYAKIRAELTRALHGTSRFDAVVVSDGEPLTVWLRNDSIPSIELPEDVSAWKAIVQEIDQPGTEIVGWSGASDTRDRDTRPGLVLRIEDMPTGDGWRRVPLQPGDAAFEALSPDTRSMLIRARNNLAHWLARPEE